MIQCRPADQQKKKKITIVLVMSTLLLFMLYMWSDLVFSSSVPGAAPRIKRLFPPDGPIFDVSNGSMSTLQKMLEQHHIKIVMYYAPWSGKSRKHVTTLKNLAKYLLNTPEVVVLGINCWVGSCRKSFPSPYFPRIFLYHSHHVLSSPIEYLGDIQVEKMVEFIQASFRPLLVISNKKQLDKYFASYDNTVLVYLDRKYMKMFKFKMLIQVALKLLNEVNSPKLGLIVNSSLSKLVKLTYHGQIVCKTFNGKDVFYPTSSKYTVVDIKKWILSCSKQIVKSLLGQEFKIIKYVKELQSGPALILFLPQPSVTHVNIKSNFRDTALLYYNCRCPTILEETLQASTYKNICITFIVNPTTVCTLCQHCINDVKCVDQTFAYVNSNSILNSTGINECICVSYYESAYTKSLFTKCCFQFIPSLKGFILEGSSYSESTDSISLINNSKKEHCVEIIRHTNFKETVQLTTGLLKEPGHLHSQASEDDMIFKKILRDRLYEILNNTQIINDNDDILINQTDQKETNEGERLCGASAPCCYLNNSNSYNKEYGLEGLACRTNKTLGFYELDSLQYSYIMKSFGIEAKTSLLLVDVAREESHVIKNDFSKQRIGEFILNYTSGYLQQLFVSSTHSTSNKQRANRHTNKGGQIIKKTHIEIIELTSETFRQEVMKQEKSVFVMFYTKWCGICKTINLTFLKLSRAYTKHNIKFSRVDGSIHDLPWEFKPSIYPSFILFPAYRKRHTVSYPSTLEYTLDNFVTFLDRNYLHEYIKLN